MKRSMFVLAAFALLTVAWGQMGLDEEYRFPNRVDKMGVSKALDVALQRLDHLQATVDVLTRKVTKLQRSVDSLTVLVDERTKLPDGIFDLTNFQRSPDMLELQEYYKSRGWSMP